MLLNKGKEKEKEIKELQNELLFSLTIRLHQIEHDIVN